MAANLENNVAIQYICSNLQPWVTNIAAVFDTVVPERICVNFLSSKAEKGTFRKN